ncbi:MAG: hypothetical protein ACLVEZ_01295 [Mediterraneibacter faecis]
MIESRIKSFMRKDNCANFLRTEKLYIIVTYYSERGTFGWTALEKRCIKTKLQQDFNGNITFDYFMLSYIRFSEKQKFVKCAEKSQTFIYQFLFL